ncbi:MAG: CPBP family intramembrane metalloprotease [Myxococcales bacterium]|nr:MAG: CPBP family intramembrane metalloprotease [Myxococcales bacterium]
MTARARCRACARTNAETAKFCRFCGVIIEPEPVGDELGRGALEEVPPLPSAPPVDGQRIFRELCWLCGLPLVVCVVYAFVVQVWAPSALAATLATASMVAIALVGAARSGSLVASSLRLPRPKDILPVLAVALVAAPTLTLAFHLLQSLGFTFDHSYLLPYERDGWPSYVAYLDLALVTPIAEELLYRGLIQPKLELIINSTEAWIVQAALFSAAHLSPVILVTHFGMGLALGLVKRRSGSLLPGILLHGAWNAWVVATAG